MMNEKHSSVCYIFREGAFSPVKEGKPFRNDFGLDLFQYKGAVYEAGRVCISVPYRRRNTWTCSSSRMAGSNRSSK